MVCRNMITALLLLLGTILATPSLSCKLLKSLALDKKVRHSGRDNLIGASGGLLKASGGAGRGGLHSGWVAAGHQGNWIGEGRHIGLVTRGWGVGGRTFFPPTKHQGRNHGRNGKKINYRGRGGPSIGGGPGRTHAPSTTHGGGKFRGIYHTASIGGSDRSRYHVGRGHYIGGGPRKSPFSSTTHHEIDKNKGVYHVTGKSWHKKHYHSNLGSDRGKVGRIVGGGPGRTHMTLTSHHYGSSGGRDHYGSDSGKTPTSNILSKNFYHSADLSDRIRNGVFLGGGPQRTRFPLTNHHDISDNRWGGRNYFRATWLVMV